MKKPRRISATHCIHCGDALHRHPLAITCLPCAHEIQALAGWAGRVVRSAIRRGMLPPITADTQCVDCGAPASCYDHRNYLRPVHVEPVCQSCNIRRGPVDMTIQRVAA